MYLHKYALVYKSTGERLQASDELEPLVSLRTVINREVGSEETVIVEVRYLPICASCKPLNKLHGSHTMCPSCAKRDLPADIYEIWVQKQRESVLAAYKRYRAEVGY
jgi:hypothetical protein